MKHTSAIGITRFDENFKVGYKDNGFTSREEGFSPISRTNMLRKRFLDGGFEINSERALLITEGYKMYEQLPTILQRANALKYILENITLHIYDDELITGNIGAPNKHAPVYPEFSFDWVIDEMENFPFNERKFDNYEISKKTKEDLRSIANYWKGKTVEERITSQLTFDQKKASNLGIGMYILNLYQYGGVGHYVFDYKRLLEKGFGGLKKEIEDRLSKVDETSAEGFKEKITLEAFKITIEGAIIYTERHAKAYEEKAYKETDETKKQELTNIANNLKHIAKSPAENFWQASQLVHMATIITIIESNGHSISYGRIDQYMHPYYKKSLDSGEFTKEFMQEIIESHYIKIQCMSKLRDRMTSLSNTGRGYGGESLTVGGVDRDGNDVTNDLTFMYLDAAAHTRMVSPWPCLRMSEKTPHELKVKAFSIFKSGCTHPKLFNDQACIPAQIKSGRSLEDAREYSVVGCVEPVMDGREFGWCDAAYINISRVLELALNDGRCFNDDNTQIGLHTGSLETYKNIEEIKEAYVKQMKYFTDQLVASLSVMDYAHRDLAPTPYASVFFKHCIETAKDMTEGGCEINHTGPQGTGIATTADSLANIDQLVFKQGKYTGKEMLDAVKANWEGYDKLYAEVNSSKLKHFGNDDDYADAFATFAYDTYCDNMVGRQNPRGGTYKVGVYGVSSNVALGMMSAGSLDGRKAMEPISDNMSPVHTVVGSHDISGPTAIANSVAKMDHTKAANGTLLNWKFNPTSVSGDTGTENLINLIDTFFDKKGMHSQFNILSSDTLRKAKANPDQYKDLLIRVAGYCAYFVELSEGLQDDLIGRTELSFE